MSARDLRTRWGADKLQEMSKWDPLEGIGGPNNDKSQDTKWLREGFLHRGMELDEAHREIERMDEEKFDLNSWRVEQVSKILTELRRALVYKARYRAAFGLTLGCLIVTLLTE